MTHTPSDVDNIFKEHSTKVKLNSRHEKHMTIIISVISYLSIVGWLAAMLLSDKISEKNNASLARFHSRQSLGLIVTGAVLLFIPLIGWLLNFAVLVVWLTCIYSAIQGKEYKVPLLGDFYQEHLDFIK